MRAYTTKVVSKFQLKMCLSTASWFDNRAGAAPTGFPRPSFEVKLSCQDKKGYLIGPCDSNLPAGVPTRPTANRRAVRRAMPGCAGSSEPRPPVPQRPAKTLSDSG